MISVTTGHLDTEVPRAAPRRRPSGVRLRRRAVLIEVVGAAVWCVVGFHLLVGPTRRFEVSLAAGLLHLFGVSGVSGALGDAFIIFGPGQQPIVAQLTPSCSAINSILALSALGFVVLRERAQVLMGLVAATSWVLLANQLRLISSLLAGRYLHLDVLVWFHDWVGAGLNFCYTIGGLLIMIAFTMHMPERAEQDRSGRHTARRPDTWARPGLGYRVELNGRPPAPRIRVAAFVHRHLLPRSVSRRLAGRRERGRIDYRIGHLEPAARVEAVRRLAGRGLAAHTATLVAVATYETDTEVLDALADAVAARQWEPVSDRQIAALRLWARAWMMRAPDDDTPTGKLVAVTGAGGPAGVAVIRALRAAGRPVLALDASPDAVGLRLATNAEVVPRADAPDFGDELVRILDKHRPAALICTVAEEYAALHPLVARLTALECATWLPDPAAVEVCLDKRAFAQALRAAAVPHPPTAATRAATKAVPGPWIVKPARGRGSRGVVAADTRTELHRAFATVPEPIAQTRLAGREFTADVLVGRDGTLLTCVPRWRDETKAGISVRGTTFDSTAVTAVVAATLRAVGLTGPANVQGFVADPQRLDGDPDADVKVHVVEVNPRFSGGLPLTLAAGVDVVGTYLAGILAPDAPLPRLTFQPGVHMARYFAEVYYADGGEPVPDPLASA